MNTDDVTRHVLPQFFPGHWLDTPGMVYSDFPSRIRVGYVLRDEGTYSYICRDELAILGLAVEELHAAALDNLACLPSAAISIGKVPGGAEGWIHAREDNFAAVRILLPDVQDIFRAEIGEEFLVTLPHRDDCFCWSLSQSAERQEKHAKHALDAFLQEEYNLTPDILLCSHRRFSLRRQQIIPEPCGEREPPMTRVLKS